MALMDVLPVAQEGKRVWCDAYGQSSNGSGREAGSCGPYGQSPHGSETGNLCVGCLLVISQRLRIKSSGMNVETSYFYSACFLENRPSSIRCRGTCSGEKRVVGQERDRHGDATLMYRLPQSYEPMGYCPKGLERGGLGDVIVDGEAYGQRTMGNLLAAQEREWSGRTAGARGG
jgi:hypothetical protein